MNDWAKEILRSVAPVKEYRTVISVSKDNIWSIDLADMSPEWLQENDGFRYIFVVIDCYTRYIWTEPLKSKTPKETWGALSAIMKRAQTHPNKLWTDEGTEFYNVLWDKECKKLGMVHYSSYGVHKACMAERAIRTLKERIWLYFYSKGTRKWITVLPSIVKEYNDSVHRSIHMTPTEARTKEGSDKMIEMTEEPLHDVVKPRLAVGDWVRISRQKGVFEKGHHGNWSYELFKIKAIKTVAPPTYILEDYDGEVIKGSFYDNELQKTNDPTFFPIESVLKERTVKGKKESLVKYVGYKEPEWILKNKLLKP